MKACDVMTTNVATVLPDTSVQEIAQILLDRHISGLPVVKEDGTLVGIVSEGDLIRRQETETTKHRSWWLELLTPRGDLARDYAKAHGRQARDIMTENVVSVNEDTDLNEVASLLERNRIKRVPVCRNDKLVGIVSRANLVQALSLRTPSGAPNDNPTDDRRIREQLTRELREANWADVRHLNFLVDKGVIHLWGIVQTEDERHALRAAASNIEGVKGVHDDLEVSDHPRLKPEQAHPYP